MNGLHLIFWSEASFGTSATVPWGNCGRPNAPAFCCQEWCFVDECRPWSCAHSPIQAAVGVALLQTLAVCNCFQQNQSLRIEDNHGHPAHVVQFVIATHGYMLELPLSPEVSASKRLLRCLWHSCHGSSILFV